MAQLTDIRQKTLYGFGNLANGTYNGINNAILGPFLSHFTSNPFIIGYLGNSRTIEGVIIQPLVGRASDRTASPLGRRRPYILFGIPLAVLFLLLVPWASHQQRSLEVPLIAAAITLFSIAWNIAQDPYSALMIDITAEKERSLYNSILSAVSLIAQVAIVVIGAFAAVKKNSIPDSIFYLAAIFMFICYVIVFLGVKEPREAIEVAQKEEKVPLRTYIADLQTFRESFKLLMSIFFMWTGLNAILPFITTVPTKIVHATTSQSLTVYAVMILVAAVCTYPWGLLASRYGNRPCILAGTLMLLAAAVIGLTISSYLWFFPLGVLAGAGFSATTALTYPYLSELVPGSKIGVFTGIQTAFSAVAVPLTTLVTGILIDNFGWSSVFAVLAVGMVFDVLFLLMIDEQAARDQIRMVEEEEWRMALQTAPAPTA